MERSHISALQSRDKHLGIGCHCEGAELSDDSAKHRGVHPERPLKSGGNYHPSILVRHSSLKDPQGLIVVPGLCIRNNRVLVAGAGLLHLRLYPHGHLGRDACARKRQKISLFDGAACHVSRGSQNPGHCSKASKSFICVSPLPIQRNLRHLVCGILKKLLKLCHASRVYVEVKDAPRSLVCENVNSDSRKTKLSDHRSVCFLLSLVNKTADKRHPRVSKGLHQPVRHDRPACVWDRRDHC